MAGAAMSAKSAQGAANANVQSQKNTNAANYRMFQEARGSTGNAVLPVYQAAQERQMSNDAISAYNAYHQNPMSQKADFTARINQFAPAQAMTTQLTNGLFNGGVRDQLQSNFAPVASARIKFTRGAAIDALNKTLQEIGAAQTGRGFSGDSFGSSMLRMAGQKAAGDAVAGANIQNTEDQRTINDKALELALNNMNLPYQQAQQALNFANLPQNAAIDQVAKEQSPFRFFYLGQGTPPKQDPVTYTATPSVGQMVAGGLAQSGGSYLQMQQQKQMQQAYLDAMLKLKSPMPAPMPAGYGASAYEYGTQPDYNMTPGYNFVPQDAGGS